MKNQDADSHRRDTTRPHSGFTKFAKHITEEMKFIICIIGLLFLAIASNEAGSLRKQSLQQRAKSLRALVAKTNPQEASADKENQQAKFIK